MKNHNEISASQPSCKNYILMFAIVLFMFVLIVRLFQLQILNVDKYRYEANLNHILEIPIRAPRGDIFDRNGVKLAQNHIQYDLYIATIGDKESDATHLESIAKLVNLSKDEIATAQKIMEKASGEAPVLVKTDIPLSMVVELKERGDEYQYALVEKSSKRSYPYGELTAHVIGYLREIDEKRLKELKGSGYVLGDIVGGYGIERQYETSLKGVAGRKMMEVDHKGNWKGLLKNWEEDSEGEWVLTNQEFPPTKGKDLKLTLDIELQKRVATEVSDNTGGVIIMVPKTGEILALYSYPSFDSNLFVGPVNSMDWSDIMDDPLKPMQNRLIQNSYPPGSVFKVLMAFASMNENVVTAETRVSCRGRIEIGDRIVKCWNLTGHGVMDICSALSQSCDVFFYTIGLKLGVEKIDEYCGLFKLDGLTGIDLPSEKAGFIPSEEWKKSKLKERWYAGDTVNFSIGQGFLQLTPIGIIRLYAYFSNGGHLINPHLNEAALTRDETPEQLKNINPLYLQKIQDGLEGTVAHGTARSGKSVDFNIAGKTGTAEDPPRKKPHSWFVSFAPAENPKVVMLAVPIAKRIYESEEMRKYILDENLDNNPSQKR
jgi:penicillin-binding protein 2